MRWKVWYGDGSTFSDEDGAPEEAPAFNIQCISQPDWNPPKENIGTVVRHGYDWYFWYDDNWEGVDLSGLLDHLLHNIPISAVKQGRTCRKFDEILKAAMEDPDMPRKSGKRPRQEHPTGMRPVGPRRAS